MMIYTEKEKAAGYISTNNEIYADAPDYIKEMAKSVNEEYKKIFDTEFFTFTKEKFGAALPFQIEIRKELENKYFNGNTK